MKAATCAMHAAKKSSCRWMLRPATVRSMSKIVRSAVGRTSYTSNSTTMAPPGFGPTRSKRLFNHGSHRWHGLEKYSHPCSSARSVVKNSRKRLLRRAAGVDLFLHIVARHFQRPHDAEADEQGVGVVPNALRHLR